MFLTRSPLGLPLYCYKLDLVRLACVKPAASVRPEPGSNSPSRTSDLRRLRSGKSVGLGGNNPKDPVPNLIVFFVLLGWMGIHPEIDRQYRRHKAALLPALLFSLLFCFQGANALGMYPLGSDTDPHVLQMH